MPANDGGPPDADREQRRDWACIGGPALVVLVLYLLCACRTVFVGDSGELAAVASTYGIPHPSGYPLYALAAGTWVRIFPFGSDAFAANTFSSICSAGAVAVLSGFLLELLRGRPGRRAAAVGTALLVGCSAAWWQESTVARVYHLNSVLSLALFWAAWRAGVEPSRRRLILTGVLAGLALANHLAAVGAVVGAAAFWIAARRADDRTGTFGDWAAREWRVAAAGAAAVLPGLCLYLWLPLRYAQKPLARWSPIVSLSDLAGYVMRTDYSGRSWTAGSPLRTLHALGHGVWVVGAELTLVGLGLAVAGGWVAFRKQRPLLIGVAVWLAVFSLLFVTHGQRRDIFLWDRYWLPAVAGAAIGVGLGWQAVLARLPRDPARWAVVLLLPVLLCGWNWARCDRSRSTLAADVSRRILERLRPHTRLTTQEDNTAFPILYLLASREVEIEGLVLYSPMQPDVERRQNPDAVRAGYAVWTHPPDWGADATIQVDTVGLIGVGRMQGQPPWEPDPWERWAVPSAENAPPRDAVHESHERELLSHYFLMKGCALAPSDAAAAEAALTRAEHYAHRNELSMLNLRDALRRLGRTEWANRLQDATRAFAPEAIRALPPAGPPPADLPAGPPGAGPAPGGR